MDIKINVDQLKMICVDDLIPYENNSRTHPKEQIQNLRKSLRKFGFVNPILVDEQNNVIRGHGILIAAKQEGIRDVPCVSVANLTEAQRKAYVIADNRLAELSRWDNSLVLQELDELRQMNFDISSIGFESLDDFEDNTESFAIDLAEDSDKGSKKTKICFCPKCGFEFEVSQ